MQKLQMLTGKTISSAEPSMRLYSVQQKFYVAGFLLGGMPGDAAVFDTAIVTEMNQSEHDEMTDNDGENINHWNGSTMRICTVNSKS
jgi:hypothetical protein